MSLNEISVKDITQLEPEELVKLMDLLIAGELNTHFLPSQIDIASVPRPITVQDGGEDAHVQLSIDPSKLVKSEFLKNAYTSFQCKATDMSPGQCSEEIQKAPIGSKVLKTRIQECVDKSGEYILVTTTAYTDKLVAKRVKSIRNSLAECGVSNGDTYPVRVFDANRIAYFTNKHLAAISYVQQCRGITRNESFQIWAQWKQSVQANKKYVYQESPYLAAQSEKLYKILEVEKIVRVVGHKGIGKTRFVLESFNPIKSDLIKNWSDRLVYIDLAGANEKGLAGFLLSNNNLSGIIVIDNCSDEWHDFFSIPIRSGGNLKIITLNDSQASNPSCILLERKSQQTTVKLILENCFPGLDKWKIDHLLDITQGFPEMIPFIEDAITKSGSDIIYNTIPDLFIQKFLFPEEKDKEEYDLFRACALFTEFSFFDDKIEDLLDKSTKDAIKAQNTLIHTKFVDTATTAAKFYKFCVKYRDKRSLLEKRGYLYSVIPEPIAVNLAAEWWAEHDFSFVEEMLTQLNETKLLIPMMDRVSTLDQSDRARGIAAKAWGPNGPFVTAEVLNTELGSRLFRSVVEVNPESTLEGLELAFDEFSSLEFKNKVTRGRRNLVWALEKLAFRKETFEGACKLLLQFGAGENENFGNNATAQFLQLFHIQLPGTEANFDSRLTVINWGLQHSDPEVRRLVISAMGSGLRSHGFSRSGGAEKQGFSTFLKDYQPSGWGEIAQYWITLIQSLTKIAVEDRGNSQLAKDTIAGSIRSMFYNNLMPVIKDAILKIIENDSSVWESAIKNLKLTRSYESNNEEEIETIDYLISLLSPSSIKDKLQLTVSLPIWDHSPENLRGEVTQKAAENLAIEIAEQNIDISQYLPLLLSGEQRQTFNFGVQLAKSFSNPDSLIEASLTALKSLPKTEQNPALIAGMLIQQPSLKQRKILSSIMTSSEISFQAFHLIRLTNPTYQEILELFELVDNNAADISHFSGLQYGRMLDNLSPELIISICEKISGYGDKGAWTALSILGTYYYQDENKWDQMKDFIRNFTMHTNLMQGFGQTNQSDGYQYGQAVLRLLTDSDDTEYAIAVSQQFIEALRSDDFPYFDYTLKSVASILFEQYFTLIWPIFSDAIIASGRNYLAIKEIIGSNNGANGHSGLLRYADPDIVIKWIKENDEGKALRRIAYMMPLFGHESWHPFGRRIIDEFGESEGFLDEVGANLGSFGMVGSSEDYYRTIITMMKELKNHTSATVRKWAKNGIKYYEKRILIENLEEESRH